MSHADSDYWFTRTPHGICRAMGIDVTSQRAKELNDLFDGNIGGWYYLAAATLDGTDEAAKWILGSLAARLNELGKPFSHANHILPADYLASFVTYLKTGKFERSFAKDVFAELMSRGQQFHESVLRDDMTQAEVQAWVDSHTIRRLHGDEVMDEIIALPRFEVTGSDEIDSIIESVILANVDQASKVTDSPKLLQWFVGQVMKASKGKAPAPLVQERLRKRVGV